MKSVIVNPFTPIPKSDKSHVRGWAMVWAQRLGADIATKDTDLSGYEKIYIDHGVNFSGAMNLFGGFTDDIVDRFNSMIESVNKSAKLYSLDWHIHDCNYVDQIEKRICAKTTSERVDFDFLVDVEELLSQAKKLTMGSLDLPGMILGDSHSVAYSNQNQMIKRINGQTLYSAMKQGLYEWILNNSVSFETTNLEVIELCLGSIDIRFHALQQDRWSAKEFAQKYAQQVISAQDEMSIQINVCAPVPIEFEERRIPKTGQYKGVNFNGSRQERLDYTLRFIEELDNYCCDFDLIMPPKEWYEMDGEQYAKDIMELSSSVHIAPRNYRSTLGWSQ